ncbi:sulfurtransferase [Luteimonas sp. MC1828]|uniref:sulfurtransferase n=1 Tax=Luteimonas sp. MC1828 TaxID=2799787 RepID=UPI0018F27023|nr:sulfurtransferase [Luteimonas sp. MC1828]MBJ7574591.1 sulfurtransferase [Luteimonas sp. MC1828]
MNPHDSWTTLVSPDQLAARLGAPGLVVLDARFALAAAAAAGPGSGEDDWREAHIPGAYYAHLERDLSAAHAPGAGRHPWPDEAAFARTLAGWDIVKDSQVVVYDAADGAFAARAWCLLRLAGHAAVAVLDGGLAAWRAQGLRLDAASPAVATTQSQPFAFDRSRLFDAARVQEHLAAGGLVLDARAGERFRGDVEPIDRVAGHVPGARSRPYADNLEVGRFKSSTRLATEFGALLDGRPPSDVVAMCGSGVTACHHLLAMAHAGLDGAGLYTGSWSGWIEDPARPVATGPG